MNLSLLDGEALIGITKQLVKEERLKTLQVIEHLQEIYDRRLHLERGYRSLHEFLVKVFGYDDGSAHRRISAMRLVQELPEAKQSIAEGKLSLTNATQLQSFFKVAACDSKLEVLKSVEGATTRECEKRLSSLSPEFGRKEDEELEALLGEFRQLSQISDDQEAIKQALRLAIKKLKESPRAYAEYRVASAQKLKPTQSVPRGVLPKAESRRASAEVDRQIWMRDQGRCGFTVDGRRCSATQHLEIDHITPWALGGETRLENLRLLCRAHNRYLGKKIA